MDWLKIAIGVIGGLLVYPLGGGDLLLQTLFWLVVIDYISGMVKSGYKGELSSRIGAKGILKKVAIYLVIAVAVRLEQSIGVGLPLREITITFYIVNESLSILENLGGVIDLPESLRKMLENFK